MCHDRSKKPLRLTTTAFFTAIIVILFSTPNSNAGNTFQENIRFNFGVGLSNYNMERGYISREYLDNYNFSDSDIYPRKRIEGGHEYYGEFLFDLFKNISIGSGVLYSDGKRDLSQLPGYLDDYYNRMPDPIIYEASLIAPYLKLRYGSLLNGLHYSINANLYYGFASLSADVFRSAVPPTIIFDKIEFSSRGMGYSFSLGFSFKLSDRFHIDNAIGYRRLVTGRLIGPGDNELENLRLNFNGMFIHGGISLKP